MKHVKVVPTTRTCSACLAELPITCFPQRKGGLYNTRGQCAECISTKANTPRTTPEGKLRTQKYNKNRVRAMKYWFLAIKESLKCSRCSESRSVCLDFHHSDPSTKERNVSAMINGAGAESKKRILEEISKCIVLCSNCHRVEHSQLKGRPWNT